MAKLAQTGRLDPEQVLRRPSEQEAIDFGEQPDTSSTLPQTSTATSSKRVNTLLLAWRRHISISVPHVECRDHFANERTALGWIRTAQAFAMLGVIIAQSTRLARSPNPDPYLGFFIVSIPLSSICHIMALIVTAVGSYRFFRYQAAMAKGRALSGGWEIIAISLLTSAVLLCLFILVLIISIRRANE